MHRISKLKFRATAGRRKMDSHATAGCHALQRAQAAAHPQRLSGGDKKNFQMLDAASVGKFFAETSAGLFFNTEIVSIARISVLGVPPVADTNKPAIDFFRSGFNSERGLHGKSAGRGISDFGRGPANTRYTEQHRQQDLANHGSLLSLDEIDRMGSQNRPYRALRDTVSRPLKESSGCNA